MIKLIGITGRKGTGKDTAATALQKEGYAPISFALPIKKMLNALFEYVDISCLTSDAMLYGDLKEMPIPDLCGKSTRYALQTLGTEWGRNCIAEDIWIKIALEKAKQFDKVVITDVRFKNEATAVRAAGGKIIKIERPTVVDDNHASETNIDKIQPDFIIMNTGTIEQVHKFVLDYVKGNNEIRD